MDQHPWFAPNAGRAANQVETTQALPLRCVAPSLRVNATPVEAR
jgi:hypothetical protein